MLLWLGHVNIQVGHLHKLNTAYSLMIMKSENARHNRDRGCLTTGLFNSCRAEFI